MTVETIKAMFMSTDMTPEQRFELEKAKLKHQQRREYWADIYWILRILGLASTIWAVGERALAFVIAAVGGVP